MQDASTDVEYLPVTVALRLPALALQPPVERVIAFGVGHESGRLGGHRRPRRSLLAQVADTHHLSELVRADDAYTGSLIEPCFTAPAMVLAIIKRSDDQTGFVGLPKRWIVARFFGHLMRPRRLVRDFDTPGNTTASDT
ncbi:hypothetical protein [Kitasatospora sp. NPDC001175]|uniref:hypothetical protein n=1 Tax=Kitasatospora sp. NPDC001175 TaxID=3157103 RepID=UPI003D08AC2B